MRIPPLRLPGLPPIRVSVGTLLTVAVLAIVIHPVIAGTGLAPRTALATAAGIGLMMVLSVLVHEVAHALVARVFGAHVDHIALTLWGGHTQYRSDRAGGVRSLLISLAGPASNLLLWGLLSAAAAVVGPGALGVLLGYSAWLNLVLAVFNLLPGLPMDGGRALEALLGIITRREPLATVITAWIGRVIAAAVIAYPIWLISRADSLTTSGMLMLLWAILIASMLWTGASQALEQARVAARMADLDARALAVPAVLVPPRASVESLERELAAQGADSRTVLLSVERVDGPRGAIGSVARIDPRVLETVPPAVRADTPVSAVSSPLGTLGVLEPELRGKALISRMLGRPHPVYLVREDERVLGVIMSADVNARLRGR